MGEVTLYVQPHGGRGNCSKSSLLPLHIAVEPGEVFKEFRRGVWISTAGRLVGRKGYVHKRTKYEKFSCQGQTYFVHRAVAELFLPGVGTLVRHLNDNPLDNRVENLAWGNALQNNQDARANGCLPARLDEAGVAAARILVRSGRTCAEVARFLGVATDTLHKAVTGVTWQSVDEPPVLPSIRYPDEIKVTAVERVQSGEHVLSVAADVGCAFSTVYDWLKEAAA